MRIPVIIPNSNVHWVGGDYDIFSNRILSTLEYNGAGATPNMTFKLPVGKTVYVNWDDGNISTANGAGAGAVIVNNNYAGGGVHTVIFTGDLGVVTSFSWFGDVKIQGSSDAFKAWVNLGDGLNISSTNIITKMSSLAKLSSLLQLFYGNTFSSGDVIVIEDLPNLVTLFLRDQKGAGVLTYSQSITISVALKFIDINDCLSFIQASLHQFIDNLNTNRAARPANGQWDSRGCVAIDVAHQTILDWFAANKAWTVNYET